VSFVQVEPPPQLAPVQRRTAHVASRKQKHRQSLQPQQATKEGFGSRKHREETDLDPNEGDAPAAGHE
jgi:hypothetical protein